MENILKAMKISGIVVILCLFLSISLQSYFYNNYRDEITDTNAAIKAIGQIVAYAYQYQTNAYKNIYKKNDYINYNDTYRNCLDGMKNMMNILQDNKAMMQIDPDKQLFNALESDIDTLNLSKISSETGDDLSTSIATRAASINSFLEIYRDGKQSALDKLETISTLLSALLFILCLGTVFISQKYAKNAEEEYEEQVKKENYTDGLTGLLNQKYATYILPKFVEESDCGYLYMFDMDNFKRLNDTCGHAAGDKALKVFAKIMLSCIREKDIVCRLGGDEFILFAYGIDNDKDAIYLAKRIQGSTKHKFAGTELSIVSISCGIAPIIKGRTFNRLKNDADQALYYVKEHEKGTYHMAKKRVSKGRRTNETL